MALPPGHILACTDFSEASDAAARRAAALAREHGSRLSLLAVLPASPLRDAADFVADHYFPKDEPRFDPKRIEQAHLDRVSEEAKRLEEAVRIDCTPMLRVGRPATEIAAVARDNGADLIVAGQHGSHTLVASVLGTTTQKLLRLAPCPVLVVKRPPPLDYATLLVPSDLSPASARALAAARALAPRAALHVAHAYELPYEGLMNYAGASNEAVAHYEAAAEKRLGPELERFVEDSAPPASEVTRHIRHRYPATAIDEWIASLKPDLVVLAAHGRGEVQRLFLGSVSLHVAISAPCDVLLVRDEEPS